MQLRTPTPTHKLTLHARKYFRFSELTQISPFRICYVTFKKVSQGPQNVGSLSSFVRVLWFSLCSKANVQLDLTGPYAKNFWAEVIKWFIIDLFHNGGQIKHSSVLTLISLSSLATTSTCQKNFCFKMRAVGLININTKEGKGGCHL